MWLKLIIDPVKEQSNTLELVFCQVSMVCFHTRTFWLFIISSRVLKIGASSTTMPSAISFTFSRSSELYLKPATFKFMLTEPNDRINSVDCERTGSPWRRCWPTPWTETAGGPAAPARSRWCSAGGTPSGRSSVFRFPSNLGTSPPARPRLCFVE